MPIARNKESIRKVTITSVQCHHEVEDSSEVKQEVRQEVKQEMEQEMGQDVDFTPFNRSRCHSSLEKVSPFLHN